jgi:magnesium chelatase accessory protein
MKGGKRWKLAWETDGADWPNRSASRFVRAGGIEWHVQQMGSGPALLLAHGTGASTHSWRALAPLLAQHFTVIAPDLPGHGFTATPPLPRLSLKGMARSLGDLLQALDISPALVAGHSAGAAVLAQMALGWQIRPSGLISLNGALLPIAGMPGHIFSAMAKMLVVVPFVPQLFAWRAGDRAVVERLIRETGSVIDKEGMDFYARLVSNPGHVSATLGMMATWDLSELERDLPRLDIRLLLIAGEGDRTVPPGESRRVQRLVSNAELILMPGLGHLAHEERPQEVADMIVAYGRQAGALTED